MADTTTKIEAVKEKSQKREIVLCIVVFVAVALVAGLLLGTLNYFTYVDPVAAIISEIAQLYEVTEDMVSVAEGRVINLSEISSEVLNAFEVASEEGEVVAVAYYVSGAGAYDGTIELVVYVEDGIVTTITVYSSDETASIGGKVLKDSNLSRLIGTDLTQVTDYSTTTTSEARSSDVYISGATYTSKAVTNAIKAVAYAWNSYGANGGSV